MVTSPCPSRIWTGRRGPSTNSLPRLNGWRGHEAGPIDARHRPSEDWYGAGKCIVLH
jgi:hypothetical protein